eukprot:scaffold180090_cov17-Tisochrysis_lutea.AAC.1
MGTGPKPWAQDKSHCHLVRLAAVKPLVALGAPEQNILFFSHTHAPESASKHRPCPSKPFAPANPCRPRMYLSELSAQLVSILYKSKQVAKVRQPSPAVVHSELFSGPLHVASSSSAPLTAPPTAELHTDLCYCSLLAFSWAKSRCQQQLSTDATNSRSVHKNVVMSPQLLARSAMNLVETLLHQVGKETPLARCCLPGLRSMCRSLNAGHLKQTQSSLQGLPEWQNGPSGPFRASLMLCMTNLLHPCRSLPCAKPPSSLQKLLSWV